MEQYNVTIAEEYQAEFVSYSDLQTHPNQLVPLLRPMSLTTIILGLYELGVYDISPVQPFLHTGPPAITISLGRDADI